MPPDRPISPRPNPIPPTPWPSRIDVNLNATVNVMVKADPTVLDLLGKILAAVQQSAEDKAAMLKVTADLKQHTDALKAAATAVQAPTT